MQLFSNTDITICDTCNADNLISYNTSDDGASASNVVLVDKGKINNVMTDYYTSSIYNIKDTGNGRSLSFDKHPIPRMRNTYLKNGTKTRQELFDSGNEFIYALDIGGGNVNTKTGDFVFHIQVAMVIQNGKPTAIIPPFLYRGNAINVLDNIGWVSNDLEFKRSICIKQNQPIMVSYGSPTIKVNNQILFN